MKTYLKKIRILRIENGGVALFVDCYINKKKAILLIDTGASNSIFDSDAAAFFENKLRKKKAECHSLNSSDISILSGKIDEFKIGKFSIIMNSAIFSSLNYINNIFIENNINTISGILGSDFLKKYKAIIDFEKKILTLKK